MVPINPNYTNTTDNSVLFAENGSLKVHPGSDGRETQWENEILPNYRFVLILFHCYPQKSTWDWYLLQIIHLIRDYHITAFYLQDCQSLPILLETDLSETSDFTEVIQGKIVVANEECGYWNCASAMSNGYSNPFLVKIARKVAEIDPTCLLCGSGYWNRSQQILQSGIIPFCDDLLTSLCALNGTEVDKSGFVERMQGFLCYIIQKLFSPEFGYDGDGHSCFSHSLTYWKCIFFHGSLSLQ